MTLSVVIPTWSGTLELADMAYNLALQVKPMCDQLIITEDGDYDARLEKIADRYLMHPVLGDVINSVYGMAFATGDYIAVINSDVIIERGDLRDLCIPDRVVSPQWRQLREYHGFQGPFFVIPRTVLDERGNLDVYRQGAGADYDYAYRVRDIFTWSDAVEFTHLAGRSYAERRRQQR